MKIKSNIPHKFLKQIQDCYELLGNEYSTLNYTVKIYRNIIQLEKEREKRPIMSDRLYDRILNGKMKPSGQTIPDKCIIQLYEFNLIDILDEDKRKIEFVANLFHEIRHAWQYAYGKFIDEEEIIDIDNNKERYFNLPSEKDAYLFQVEQVNKHAEDIFQIMEMTKRFENYSLKNEFRALISEDFKI